MLSDEDRYLYEALLVSADVLSEGKTFSISVLLRKLRWGYPRAAKVYDRLFEENYLTRVGDRRARNVVLNVSERELARIQKLLDDEQEQN